VLAQNIIFGLLAVAMGVSALKLVTTQNVVHAALYLVIVFAGIAAQYILLAAEFVAVVQVLVYIGAITVLILFGIMLTRARIGQDQDLDNNQRVLAGVVSLFLFGGLGALLWDAFGRERFDLGNSVASHAAGTNTSDIATTIFSTYLVPFEVVSVLLLAALVGAVVVARRE
jgi:NADH-quinone oxidoreductase subunit J